MREVAPSGTHFIHPDDPEGLADALEKISSTPRSIRRVMPYLELSRKWDSIVDALRDAAETKEQDDHERS